MKSLIAFYSRTGGNSMNGEIKNIKKGNTEIVAETLQELTGGEVYRIYPREEYPQDYEQCVLRAQKESEQNIHPTIKNPLSSISDYDVIYVGFPLWFRSYPRIIATFFDCFDFTGKIIKPFCTNEEGSFGIAELEMRTTLKDATVKDGISFHGFELDDVKSRLEKWIEN